ncbi:hypothetical protein BX600DRAFT_511988 [Xylariales sp. PMI_506]|nr:hypothetical protein BX600DRAFT_511988 [Xylariales sp. PMI_506]
MAEASYSLLGQHAGPFMGKGRRSFIVGTIALVVLIAFTGSVMYGPGSKPAVAPFDELIRQPWETEKLDITAPVFIDQDGDTHRLPRDPVYKKKLGKRVVILDMDTRPFDHEGELLNPLPWDWNKVEHLSAGIMSHYLYALIHGYDYMMIRNPKYEDRHDAWGKIVMMEHALKNHDWVVFFDSDAIMANPEVPIEWLMNYWRVDGNTSIAIASESLLERDKDDRGNPNL